MSGLGGAAGIFNCHFVEQPFTWPIETHFHLQNAHYLTDNPNPQPASIIFMRNSCMK
jgi:hypothetical protein